MCRYALLALVMGALASANGPAVVWRATDDADQGLAVRDGGDGTTAQDVIAGKPCRRSDLSWGEKPGYRRFVYFDVDDETIHGGSHHLALAVEYYDYDHGALRLEYDSRGDDLRANFAPAEGPRGNASNTWRRHTFYVADAELANGTNGRDFRLSYTSRDVYVSWVQVTPISAEEYRRAVDAQRELSARARRLARQRARRARAALLGGGCDTAAPFEVVTLVCGPLLQAQPGPWDDTRPPARTAFSSWKRIIDYAKSRGFCRVVASGVRGPGWEARDPDYMHVVDWTKTAYPEAALLSSAQVARTIAAANRALSYAHQQDIPVFLHNYHFSAPPGLVDKYPQITHGEPYSSQCVGNINWASSVYQQWLETAWREEFTNLPLLAGRYDTIGEMVFGTDDVTQTAEEFTRLYARVHHEMGRTPMMRNWWMHRCHKWVAQDIEHRVSPKVHYVMKFSHTDSVTRRPDVEVADWVEAGRAMSTNVYYPGENARFFLWADPRFVYETVKTSKEIGAVGMTLSRGGPSTGIGSVNDRAFVAYATGQLPLDDFQRSRWEDYLGELLGTDGEAVLRAVELYAEAIRSISRIVGHPCEGFDMRHTHFLPPQRWMSTLGFENANPPAQWREGICPFLEVLEALRQPGARWRDDIDVSVARGRISPIVFMGRRARNAEKAVQILAGLQAADKEELALLRDNAGAVALYTRYWERLLKARLMYEAVMTGMEGADLPKLGERCLDEFTECVAMLQRVAGLAPTGGPAAELALRRAELDTMGDRLLELARFYASGGWRVEAERLDVDADGHDAGYYVDAMNPGVIRLGPPGVYPFEPHYSGWVTYTFEGVQGRYEVGVEYVDDRDDRADTDAMIRVQIGDRLVHEWVPAINDDRRHTETFVTDLAPGDVIRLSGRTDRTGNEFCRIDRLVLTPVGGRPGATSRLGPRGP